MAIEILNNLIDVTIDVRSHDKSVWRKVSTVGTLSAAIQNMNMTQNFVFDYWLVTITKRLV